MNRRSLRTKSTQLKALLALLLLATGLMLFLPAAPASAIAITYPGTLETAISLSDHTPGATSNYTLYLMLSSDWTPGQDLWIDFPYSVSSISWLSPGPQYVDNSGTHSLTGTGYTFYTSGAYMDTSILIIRRSGGSPTLPAGTTVILNFQGVHNPANPGDYTVNSSKGGDHGSYTLRLPSTPTPSLTYSVVGEGRIAAYNPYTYADVPAGSCPSGTIVEAFPDADAGWYFDHWTGAFSGGSETDFFKHLFVLDHTEIGAVFRDTVPITVSWNTGGTVSPGSGDFAFGTTPTFTATHNPGYHFVEWVTSGIFHDTENPHGVPIDIAFAKSTTRTVEAVFAPNVVTFIVSKRGAGTGTVTQSQAGTTFTGRTTLSFHAVADAGSRFDHWEYDVAPYRSTDDSLTFNIDTTGASYPNTADTLRNGPVDVRAVFIVPDTYHVEAGITGPGSISTSPAAYNATGTQVTLTATPLAGYSTFTRWESSDITISPEAATNPVLTFAMPALDMRVRAVFTGNDFNLTAGASPAEGGSVSPTSGSYPYGSSVEVAATPASGWYLSGWTGVNENNGDWTDGNAATIWIRGDRTITANFARNPYSVTYSANGGTGAAPTQDAMSEGGTFTAATNTFAAPAGSHFARWNTAADGSGTSYAAGATVTMPAGDLTLYAIWEANLFFSEYLDGWNYDKALEIYNPSGLTVDLASGNYEIQIYFGASGSPGTTIDLTGSIDPGGTYVVADSMAQGAVLAAADQTTGANLFNGNDTIVLRKGTTVVDVFGQIYYSSATGWLSGGIRTWDVHLGRIPSVTQGDTNTSDAFDPSAEWLMLSFDDYAPLGSHHVNVSPVATASTISAQQDADYTFSAGDFTFTDPESDGLSQVEITTLPAKGGLALSGTAVSAGQQIAVADLSNLVYRAAAGESGTAYATFTFKVEAGGAWSAAAAAMTIDVTPVTRDITVTSSPAGSGLVTVDGQAVTTPHTFTWAMGSAHTIAAASSVGTTGTRYVFAGWSDGGDRSHAYTVGASSQTLTAAYETQYYLTVNNGGHGTAGGAGWYDDGSTARATISSIFIIEGSTRYSFAGWTGDAGGSGASSSDISMDGPKTATAAWQLSLDVTAVPDIRAYNGTTSSTRVPTLLGTLALGDSIHSRTQTFDAKDVGNRTLSPAIVVHDQGGNDVTGHYSIIYHGATGSITPAPLTVTYSAAGKVYDGTTSASIGTPSITSGIIDSEDVSVRLSEGAAGTFASAAAGNHEVSAALSAFVLDGADKANYVVSTITSPSATISPKALTVMASAQARPYDGTTAAQVSFGALQGVVGTDDVAIDSYAAHFADADAGTGKSVTVDSITLKGTTKDNYIIALPAGLTATISRAIVHAGFTAADKPYDGTTAATISGRTLASADIFGSDAVSLSGGTAAFADKNAGDGKTVTGTGFSLTGADADNYTLNSTSLTTTANITRRPVTVTAGSDDKRYDGTTTATVHVGSDDILPGDEVTLNFTRADFADKHAGNGKTVTVTGISLGGAGAENYSLQNLTAEATASIVAKDLTVAATIDDKTYDGTTAATAHLHSDDIVSGDDLSLDHTSATFEFAFVASDHRVTVTGIFLGGADAGDYYLLNTYATGRAAIIPKDLTVTASADNKRYDGMTTATAHLHTTGILPRDSTGVSLYYSDANFADPSVETGKTVSVTGLRMNGWAAYNYHLLNTTTTATADIIPAELTVGYGVYDKHYDGTSDAAVMWLGIIAGIVGYEDVTVDLAAGAHFSFESKNVGTWPVTPDAGAFTLGGADKDNYVIGTMDPAAAQITPAQLAVDFGAEDKIYDGTTIATISSSAISSGKIGSEEVSVGLASGAAGTFASRNAGTWTVTADAGAFTLAGTDSGNYAIGTVTPTTAAITRADLDIYAVHDEKTYDGGTTSAATPSVGLAPPAGAAALGSPPGSAAIGQLKDGDTVDGLVQAFESRDVLGTDGSTLEVTGYVIHDGNSGGNYSVHLHSHAGTITPRTLTLAATDQTKVYGTAFTFAGTEFTAGTTDLVGGDTVVGCALSSAGAPAGAGVSGSPYDILIGAAVAGPGTSLANYDIHFVPGKLTVTKASATVSLVEASLSAGYDGRPHYASYTTSPATVVHVDVTYKHADTTVADPTDPGSYDVTASINDPNYAGDPATGILLITSPPGPQAADDAATVLEDSGANIIDVLGNDTSGYAKTVTAVTQGAWGSVTITDAGARVTYTPDPNYFGGDSFTYTMSDGLGGTSTADVSVTCKQVNDAPSFSKGPDQSVPVSSGAQTVAGWATSISAGPHETGQAVDFVIDSNSNPALFSAVPAVSPTGTLTYTPATAMTGTATIVLHLHDDGGTADSGVNASATQSFTITVLPSTTGPKVKDDGATVLEDSRASILNVLANDTGQFRLTIASVTQPAHGSVGVSALRRTLTYKPAAQYFGPDSFTYTVSDGHGGTATATVNVTVTPVNDAPTFSKGPDQMVMKNSGAQTISGWATDISPGPNESDQTVKFVVSNNNSSLFKVQPAISSDGTLTYRPADNAVGTATVSVSLRDNGGTVYGGTNRSITRTFRISVCNRYDQSDSRIRYSGEWQVADDPGAWLENYTQSSSPGASVTIRFTGTRLDWIATIDPAFGSAIVYVDGVKKASVNLAGGSIDQKAVFTTGYLSNRRHTVTIVRADGDATEAYINIDAVDVVGVLMQAQ